MVKAITTLGPNKENEEISALSNQKMEIETEE